MGVMEKLKIFTVQEPIVVASCLIAGFGLILPAVVRPVLDSFQTAKEVPPPALSDTRVPTLIPSSTPLNSEGCRRCNREKEIDEPCATLISWIFLFPILTLYFASV
ncbi:Fiber protein fb11 [Rhynchospora pubera]|uniref:Fiber protein fb11 n=1 Tax=Rhynchospora pubera TaxID=906938 RepID=A0AAV8F2X2_9POAL|nr:Fiber protein fb11 [Rhynchospora pubera]